jgi:hypothetical protein
MKDKDKLVALIRLRDMLYFGVRPIVRQCGCSAEIVQELVKERLIQLGDKNLATIPTDMSLKKSCQPGIPLSHSSTRSVTAATCSDSICQYA